MPTVDADGVSLYYEERGSGAPMIFVHGIPTDYRAWASQSDELSKDHRVVCYSRRYAYPNRREGDVSDSTVENNASDLKVMVERLGLGTVTLVGHSYGGFIAAMLAAERTDLVSSLVLVEPAISTLLVENAESQAQLLSLLLRSPSVALSARRFQSGSLRPSLDALASGRNEVAVELNVDGVQDMKGAFASMPEPARRMMLDNARTIAELKTRFPSFKHRAKRIMCPTLVVNGSQSALWLRRIGALTAGSIAGAKNISVDGSRHFPHMEKPAEFNRALAEFVSAPT